MRYIVSELSDTLGVNSVVNETITMDGKSSAVIAHQGMWSGGRRIEIGDFSEQINMRCHGVGGSTVAHGPDVSWGRVSERKIRISG